MSRAAAVALLCTVLLPAPGGADDDPRLLVERAVEA